MVRYSLRLLLPVGLAGLLLAGCATPGYGPGPEPYPGPKPVAVSADLSNPEAGFQAEIWSDRPPPRIGDYLSLKLHASADGLVEAKLQFDDI